MNARVRASVALAAFALLAPARGLAAEPSATTLRGIAIDQRLSDEPLPADLPRIVPTIVRLSIGDTAFSGADADAVLARLQIVLGVYQSRRTTVVLALGRLPAAESDERWAASPTPAPRGRAEPWRGRRLPDR